MVNEPRAWIESEGEAYNIGAFVDLGLFSTIAVGKTGKRRDVGDAYRRGRFQAYDPISQSLLNEIVSAGPAIEALVQFGIPDMIISDGDSPACAIELTSHKPTYNNLFQRFPKLYRPAACKTPSIIFQLHDPGTMRDGKAALVTAARRAQVQTKTPCVVYLYTEDEAEATFALVGDLVAAFVREDHASIDAFFVEAERRNKDLLQEYNPARFGGKFFERRADAVIAHMRVVRNCDSVPGINCGVNHCQDAEGQRRTAAAIRNGTHLADLSDDGEPVKCMWITKGTGGLDPYPGYLLAGKLLLCYDDAGNQVLPLAARFEEIPRDFWWWDAARTRLNNQMMEEICDVLAYKGEHV